MNKFVAKYGRILVPLITPYGENEEVANEISSIFMYELLYRQTFSNVAIYKDKVVGIILGRINKCYKLKNNTTYSKINITLFKNYTY